MKTVKKEVVNPSKLAELYNEAIGIVENRHEFYGDFSKNLEIIGEYWTTFLHSRQLMIKSLTPSDVAIMLSLFKTARTANGFQNRDTFVDACNYFMQAYLSKDVQTPMDTLVSSVNVLMERERNMAKSAKMVEKIGKALGRNITEEKDFQELCKEITNVLMENKKKKEGLFGDVGNNGINSANVE